ncbi:type II toxin-antitoxin system PemK/MazF family toxin [Streptomyces sp. A7024]|uniref:Type II toxin-antitoxin system PemK/MazF family toxin n=1 Tax=Streptomyces coryli TaxID=1128680 RepID=A0A6G4U673_9ACTN|nr:type II toxin-antitoxin system PemK/MazF family toxin [Streptomyces coryli]NGN66797.1 type II toxin-antitoxin system PemK/MazF family toxin [Streptomyces coryli]
MDTSWWLALAAVAVLAIIAALVDSWGRLSRAHRRDGRAKVRRAGRPPVVRAGEIWWADVPFEDSDRSKDRPCLVVRVDGDTASVVKITSKFHGERPGIIPLPPGSVSDRRGRTSYLETDEVREVEVWDFRRKSGTVDPAIWDQVKYLADG